MTPRELLLAQRAELLAAFEASLGSGRSVDELLREVRDVIAELVQALQPAKTPGTLSSTDSDVSLVGSSAAMISLRSQLGQLARRSRAPVLFLGEPGVGRRHCARALHHITYPQGQWLEVNCPERARALAEIVATLRRRNTTEAEAGMTIYVHELGEVATEVQQHLARLFDEQAVPLRVVASSSWPLNELVRTSKLRKDLAFRFSNELRVLPLCERQIDVAPLAQHFAQRFADGIGAPPTTFTPAALALLCEYSWPGNLNELRNTIERISTDFGPGVVDAQDLPTLGERESGIKFRLPPDGIDLAELERHLLVQALTITDNNQSRAASLLGLTRDQIRYRVNKIEQRQPAAQPGRRAS